MRAITNTKDATDSMHCSAQWRLSKKTKTVRSEHSQTVGTTYEQATTYGVVCFTFLLSQRLTGLYV